MTINQIDLKEILTLVEYQINQKKRAIVNIVNLLKIKQKLLSINELKAILVLMIKLSLI